ncbi:MAG: rod shape-determining protein RodA, partial [Alistipes sp.]
MPSNLKSGVFEGIDRMAVICYLLIVLFGCLCITSASSEDSTGGLFSFGNFYMKQLVWVGVAWTFGLLVLVLEDSLFTKRA